MDVPKQSYHHLAVFCINRTAKVCNDFIRIDEISGQKGFFQPLGMDIIFFSYVPWKEIEVFSKFDQNGEIIQAETSSTKWNLACF